MSTTSELQPSAPLISVIIINFNGGAFLQEAVNSLARQTFRDFELILLDNASVDESAKTVDLTALHEAQLIMHPENCGFAEGNNIAARQARGKWLVLLNPDTVADANWLDRLLMAATENPGIQTFASAQMSLDDNTTMDGAGDAYLLFGIPWRGGFGRPATEMPRMGWCFSACGATAMYDRNLFLQLGGFDERFFCYCEDVDLGFRLQLAGYDCLFVPDAVVHHAGSGISGRASAFSTYHGTRNRIWTYAKNMPAGLLLLTLPGHVVLTLYILARNIFTPRFQPLIRGVIDGLKSASKMRFGRDWKIDQPGISNLQLAMKMAWNPWRMSGRKPHIRPLDRQ